LYKAEQNGRHFKNIPVALVAGSKKIVIGDFQPALVHRPVPSIYDAQHMGATEMKLVNLGAGRGDSRCTGLVCHIGGHAKTAVVRRL